VTDWCDVALSTSVLQRWVMFVTSDVSKNVTRHEYFPTCYSRKYRSIISGIFNEMLSLSHGLSQQFLTGFCNSETRRLSWACTIFFVLCNKNRTSSSLKNNFLHTLLYACQYNKDLRMVFHPYFSGINIIWQRAHNSTMSLHAIHAIHDKEAIA
jgi:hypothetical protein